MLGINEVADCVVGLYQSAQKNGHKMPCSSSIKGQTGIGKTSIVVGDSQTARDGILVV